MRTQLEAVYGILQRAIVPQLRYSQALYEDLLFQRIPIGARWLDIGCGHHVLPIWQDRREAELVERADLAVGIDLDFSSLQKHRSINARVCCVADKLPFNDNHFDTATANMVVEHLDNPKAQFAEINRVLKPGSLLIFHTPNDRGYFAQIRRLMSGALAKRLASVLDERTEDDVFDIQYKANNEDAIVKLASETNFTVEELRYINSDAVAALVLPVAFVELLWIRLLMRSRFRRYRTNLLVTLRKNGHEKPQA